MIQESLNNNVEANNNKNGFKISFVERNTLSGTCDIISTEELEFNNINDAIDYVKKNLIPNEEFTDMSDSDDVTTRILYKTEDLEENDDDDDNRIDYYIEIEKVENNNLIMKPQQYYFITMTSPDYYNEDKKIIVNSIKELKEFVKSEIEELKCICPDLNKVLRKNHTVTNMYIDHNGKAKIVGKVISFGKKGKLSDSEIEESLDTSYISFWCNKITKKELYQYSGFKKVGN